MTARALVTGGTGFIGRHLVSALRADGWEVVCALRRDLSPADPKITCVKLDLADPGAIPSRLKDIGPVDMVFHLGAMRPDPEATSAVPHLIANGVATMALLEAAAFLAATGFIYISSLSVLGAPTEGPVSENHPLAPAHGYALGKLVGELACEMTRAGDRLKVASLRISSPYGPGMADGSVLPRFIARAVASDDLAWYGSGERTQDFVHVDDVVRACLLAGNTDRPGVYNIGSGRSVSMKALAELAARSVPDCRSRVGAAEVADPQDAVRWEIDIRNARNHLDYRPGVTLEDGLRDYADVVRGARRVPPWWDRS